MKKKNNRVWVEVVGGVSKGSSDLLVCAHQPHNIQCTTSNEIEDPFNRRVDNHDNDSSSVTHYLLKTIADF